MVAAVLALVLGALGGCGGRPTTHHKPGTSHEQASGSAGELLAARDDDGHRFRQVDDEGAPEVALAARTDSEDGWNVHLSPRNFRFTPDSVGGAALPGRGHAHLYLDDRKVARVYGSWFHLPGSLVPRGSHRLTVRLYADDHTVWAVDGKPIEATIRLRASNGGAGHEHPEWNEGSDGNEGSGKSEGRDGNEGSDAARTVAIAIADGRVQPPPDRVELKRGERVRLKVTSDRADTLHVHGYDKEAELPAGKPVTLTFSADRTGLFEVETHDSGLVLTQLVVR
ncbi:hypothetical protein QIS96_10155 [Streptomyces sp. B-S-A6]|uniref:EfeO-type cupredoxin-like domain-containing protein n=1 Tax=Streptomyces cavernicola TaxID=3043613 RepID=A0ABT6S7V4_9ACTN|nr:hypothetical protein [Streptomyces sp. B-S-A6]MDI3404181.1 hypothetical protein [Streptomyces sp. B-S-A6]